MAYHVDAYYQDEEELPRRKHGASAAIVRLLRRQLVRVHKKLSVAEERIAWEREEREKLEEELDKERAIRIVEAGPRSVAARQLVEDAVSKAAAARRECASLRLDLEKERAERAEDKALYADSNSLRRALHNLSASFDEQERHLKSSLRDSDAELERYRQTRMKCATATQRLAETLKDLMNELAAQEDDQEDDDFDQASYQKRSKQNQVHQVIMETDNDLLQLKAPPSYNSS